MVADIMHTKLAVSRPPPILDPNSSLRGVCGKAYLYPNDASEQARLDYQNDIIMGKILEGRLHLAPFSLQRPPKRVLDVATGTGDWVIQMGDRYPTSYVEGIDLSPIQPQSVPPNVRFYVQDA